MAILWTTHDKNIWSSERINATEELSTRSAQEEVGLNELNIAYRSISLRQGAKRRKMI